MALASYLASLYLCNCGVWATVMFVHARWREKRNSLWKRKIKIERRTRWKKKKRRIGSRAKERRSKRETYSCFTPIKRFYLKIFKQEFFKMDDQSALF